MDQELAEKVLASGDMPQKSNPCIGNVGVLCGDSTGTACSGQASVRVLAVECRLDGADSGSPLSRSGHIEDLCQR